MAGINSGIKNIYNLKPPSPVLTEVGTSSLCWGLQQSSPLPSRSGNASNSLLGICSMLDDRSSQAVSKIELALRAIRESEAFFRDLQQGLEVKLR